MDKIKKSKLTIYLKPQYIGLYVVALVVLSTLWSSVKSIQKNYKLQLEVSSMQTEVEIAEQQNANDRLNIEFMKTDTYQQLQAKKLLGKALPGEKLAIVNKDVALNLVPAFTQSGSLEETDIRPKIVKNWQAWFNFLLNKN